MLPIVVTPAATAVVIADQYAQGYNLGSTHPDAAKWSAEDAVMYDAQCAHDINPDQRSYDVTVDNVNLSVKLAAGVGNGYYIADLRINR